MFVSGPALVAFPIPVGPLNYIFISGLALKMAFPISVGLLNPGLVRGMPPEGSQTSFFSIGFFIYTKLSDIYPYNLVATACLTEAAIYMRFMRMIVCPTQIFVILLYAFPVYGYDIDFYQFY